jgi:hypothetical protein
MNNKRPRQHQLTNKWFSCRRERDTLRRASQAWTARSNNSNFYLPVGKRAPREGQNQKGQTERRMGDTVQLPTATIKEKNWMDT